MASPLGSAPSIILGVGLGAAASTAIEPVVESARQTAWKNNQVRILSPELNAALVAQGAIDLDFGRTQSHLEGLTDAKFDGLVWLAQRTPTYGEAQDLRRRDKITRDQLLHTFAKAQIEQQYWDALADLVDDRLSPQNVAVAIVRGLMENPDILPVGPPVAEGKIPKFPVSAIDPVLESAASGIDKDRLAVLAGIFGRPPGPELAASATYRGIIEKVDYLRAIGEGDVRNEWAEAIFEAARQILTSGQYAEGQLRGFLTAAERRDRTARHGMSDADSDLLYDLSGRSIPVHQILTGLARGGTFDGPIDQIPPAFLQSLQRGNLRPEYFNLAYANRYSYESVFVMRTLVESGDLTEQEAHDDLLAIGWRPDRAASVSHAWATKQTAAKGNPWVAKAEQQWWTAAHKSFVKDGTPRSSIEPVMQTFVLDLADRDAIFQWWTNERAVAADEAPPA